MFRRMAPECFSDLAAAAGCLAQDGLVSANSQNAV